MNQPTEDRIKKLEDRMTRLEQQRTDEMKAINVNVASEDVTNRLKTLEDDTAVLKIEMQGARADISNIKATQSDHSEFFIQHGQRLSAIEAKQDAHTDVLGQLVNLSEGHTTRFDQIDTSIVEQGKKLDLILKLLQTRGE